ncbi:MAG: hypothetical protein SFW36_15490 [Leptolyngbyaceae cyanobacterium bins.59]|nr:hypothetical protein [Leptolyngbyaceae cyanobacterium bins.59]
MGVPEIWCYSRQGLAILQLHQNEYVECEYSSTFALLSAEILGNFLELGKQSNNHNGLINELRLWLRNQNKML